VALLCQGEQREIGVLRLTPGRAVLTAELVAGAFQPVDPAYDMPRPAGKRGELLACPRCGAPVLVRGTVRPPEKGPEDNRRRPAKRPGTAQAVPVKRSREEARADAIAAGNAMTRAGIGPGGTYMVQRTGRDTAVAGSPGMEDRDAAPIMLGSTALELRA
jgi:hypothetical protein